MRSLEKIRNDINDIDREMLKLFEKRMDCATEVVLYKLANNIPIMDAAREKEIVANSVAMLHNKEYTDYYKEFITCLVDLSKKHQYSVSNQNTAGYQGTMGAFSHIAAQNVLPQAELVAYPTFEDVFIAVRDGDVAFGVLPFENSYTGEVAEVLDLLMKYDCYIVQMYNQRVSHNLVGLKDAGISDIREVYSHHQAISQCHQYIIQTGFTAVPYPNTALAAEFVSKSGDRHKAAIASVETAKLYDLKVLAENINTSANNTTKFIVIAKRPSTGGSRFSVLFTVNHDAGQLAQIIQIVARHNFNMENIRSRPLRDLPWQYYFYIELVGNPDTPEAQALLKDMASACKWLKVLGGYNLR